MTPVMPATPIHPSDLLQFIVIAALLSWSVFFMLRRSFPAVVQKQQLRLTGYARSHGWLKLANWLTPNAQSAGGCGSGCSNCSSCGSNPAATEQPVQWKTQPSKHSGCH